MLTVELVASILLLSSMVSKASFLVSVGKPVILFKVYLIPYLFGILRLSIIFSFDHLLSRISLLNFSLPCSIPKDILSKPT